MKILGAGLEGGPLLRVNNAMAPPSILSLPSAIPRSRRQVDSLPLDRYEATDACRPPKLPSNGGPLGERIVAVTGTIA